MSFKKFEKPNKKPCLNCGEPIEIMAGQKYCDACRIPVARITTIRSQRRQKEAWNALTPEDQLWRIDLAAKRLLDDPEIKWTGRPLKK